ncbi:MAG: cytochrome c biogenesis CcdA family protein [Methanothrix sp.]|jgi:cytochrome c biogenesis protein CcdA|nr:cytochrome c biogenesis CcdA family protein [Methanothrix sp.]
MSRIAVVSFVLALILLVGVALVFSNGVVAIGKNDAGATEVIIIKSPGCTKCAAAERALEKIGRDMPLNVTGYYYYSDEGHRIIKQYRAKDVPAIIIGMQVINYRDYEGDNALLESLIKGALANQTPNLPAAFTLPGNESTKQNLSAAADGPGLNLQEISFYTISAVLGAGLVAGFNPCLLGILVFLAASVLSTTGRKRELVMMVVSFSFGIFTMYFLFGLGMQELLQTEAIASAFRYVLTAFLLLAGLSQVWDALRLSQGRPSLFRTDWALKYFKAGVDKGRFSSYFLIGALFSLVKAPCVGAIYLAILDLLSARSYFEGAAYLFFFNLGVILPIIVIGGAIALGMSPEQVDAFRKDHRVGMRLATGLALLALAPLIYWQLI